MEKQIIPITVRIFGKEYQVACPEGEENNLLNSAKRVDTEMRRVRESGKVVGTDRVAVMVSLNLAYELLLAEQRTDEAVDEYSLKRLKQIQQDIETAIEQYKARDN